MCSKARGGVAPIGAVAGEILADRARAADTRGVHCNAWEVQHLMWGSDAADRPAVVHTRCWLHAHASGISSRLVVAV